MEAKPQLIPTELLVPPPRWIRRRDGLFPAKLLLWVIGLIAVPVMIHIVIGHGFGRLIGLMKASLPRSFDESPYDPGNDMNLTMALFVGEAGSFIALLSLLLATIGNILKQRRLISRGQPAIGIVVDKRSNPKKPKNTMITIQYSIDNGKSFSIRLSPGKNHSDSVQIAQELVVVYDPKKPTLARVYDWGIYEAI